MIQNSLFPSSTLVAGKRGVGNTSIGSQGAAVPRSVSRGINLDRQQTPAAFMTTSISIALFLFTPWVASSCRTQVVFERFWWDRAGEAQPTGTPPGATVDGAKSGLDMVDWFVQAAGQAMFFDGLSVFPVLYLDDDLCVFQFKPAGIVVAAQRAG